MTFLHCGTLAPARLASVLLRNELPVTAAQRRASAAMMLHTQRENLYLSLQGLNDKLQRIHAADTEVLGDVLLQAQILAMAIRGHNEAVQLDESALDDAPWVRPLAEDVDAFLEKLQELYKVSPLYLWPFSKLRELIEECTEPSELMPSLVENVAATMLASHRWGIDQLRAAVPRGFEPMRLNIIHYEDVAAAAELFLGMDAQIQHHYSVEAETVFNEEEFAEFAGQGSDIVLAFFEENMAFAMQLEAVLVPALIEKWNDKTRVFILTDTSFQFPSHLICVCRLWAIE
jgi:hypothetical protein